MPWNTPPEIDLLNQNPSSASGTEGGPGYKMTGRRCGVVAMLALSISRITVNADTTTSKSWTSALSATFDELVREGAESLSAYANRINVPL